MQDRQAWLEARRKGIGGTDVAAILGLSRYRTAIDVYEDKVGIAPEREVTPAMQWGLYLEEPIARAYELETGRRVRRVGMRRAKHVRDFPMIGSIDRETYLGGDEEPRIVEIKTSRSAEGFADREGWRDVDPELRIPPDHYVQVQHYLEVAQRSFADLVVLIGGQDLRTYEIPRDQEYGADLRLEEGRFWRDYVLANEYPPASADDLANLSRRFPRDLADERVATSEESVWIWAYLDAVRDVETAETRRDELRARLEDSMGTTPRLVAPGATVSWKAHERTSTGWKEYATVLERVVEEAREKLRHVVNVGNGVTGREVFERILLEGAGTTDLADVRTLYQTTTSVRPFRVDRKEKE